jgi:hypothetical protein
MGRRKKGRRKEPGLQEREGKDADDWIQAFSPPVLLLVVKAAFYLPDSPVEPCLCNP